MFVVRDVEKFFVSGKESVGEILKDIVIKNTKEYLKASVPKHLPKNYCKTNIVNKTGINGTTLGRILKRGNPIFQTWPRPWKF